MKKLTVTFEKLTYLTPGLEMMVIESSPQITFTFELEEEEIEMTIDELDEMDQPFTYTVIDA